MSKDQITKNQFFRQVPGNIASDMDGEKVMLNIQQGKYYNLGELGGEIWELMKTPISMEKLVTTLLSQYDVEPNECEEQVTTFLNQLLEEDLILIEEQS
ncbi:metallophosphoesterase [Aneurinibacillus migulanus]|uniref:Coenzyme PQQ synthesis protein D (PqqD) n=1 Tax=Aneurinibacillus migulanus TaxID=47500 RepID=A0A0M0H7A3_ANEMI|nr:lasso peptide biosynthesis PqqD family chaperone [Aneurinibacillus migulanus]KON97611.1 metallophosphoesterase [Aneurinibacillus migulanus]KPD07862.1 metallophosphoesterase [Aneurinibacillus migulanus]MCP1359120.1 lasso peptide biosynthesis PqqD family chaperone [Aneurinibacillus migulanus]MED0896639.1 lasso peptide biosynthesis PqqD family chaperone [Aneurinibacillus migulanus]MED1616018.1 lasso peptide biosynthesis PqqD family chaperone [Aneurinibacillus migulanus]